MAKRNGSTKVETVCGWCDGFSRGFQFRASGGRAAYAEDFRPCTHPGPVTIQALPGATFRTTKYESTSTGQASNRPMREAKPTMTPPADRGAAFVKACAKARKMLAALPADITFDTFDQPTAQPVAA